MTARVYVFLGVIYDTSSLNPKEITYGGGICGGEIFSMIGGDGWGMGEKSIEKQSN